MESNYCYFNLCPFVTLSHRKTHVFPGRFLPKEVAEGIYNICSPFLLWYAFFFCVTTKEESYCPIVHFIYFSHSYILPYFPIVLSLPVIPLLEREPASATAFLHPCISKAKKPARIFAGFLCRSTLSVHRLGKSPPAYLRAFSGARKGYKGEGRLGTTATMAVNPLARSPLGDAPK